MPTLVVIRHAKADRPAATADIDRPLLPAGREDARAAGRWIASEVGRPGLLVTSPARRTVETVDGLLASWGDDPPPVVTDEAVYEASLGDLLRVVRGLDDDESRIAVVGHNPGLSALVTELTGETVELDTSGVALVEVPSAWADTPAFACRLLAVTSPRG